MTPTAAGPRAGTPIGWPLRAWFAAEVFFGVAALLSIGLDPATPRRGGRGRSSRSSWGLFGAFYFAVAPIMLLAVFAKRWEMVRVLVPTAISSRAPSCSRRSCTGRSSRPVRRRSTSGSPGHPAPPIFLATLPLAAAPRGAEEPERPAPAGAPAHLPFVLGGFLSVEAVVAFAPPPWFSGDFPWSLTPLTTRALCGFLLALGALMVTMAVENDRDRVRLASPMLILVLPAVALQVARYLRAGGPLAFQGLSRGRAARARVGLWRRTRARQLARRAVLTAQRAEWIRPARARRPARRRRAGWAADRQHRGDVVVGGLRRDEEPRRRSRRW